MYKKLVVKLKNLERGKSTCQVTKGKWPKNKVIWLERVGGREKGVVGFLETLP